MENFLKKLLMMSFVGTAVVGFTACSDDDDEEGGSTGNNDNPLEEIVNVYVDDVVYPTYARLADYADELADACSSLYEKAEAGTMTQDDIDAACEAFSNARVEWERSEAWLYGAAEDYNIDPHIDSWPLDQGQMANFLTDATMLAGIKGDNPVLFVREHNADFDTALGFHGLEFVLFREGRNRTVAELSANDTMEGLTSVSGLDELAFLSAVAGDVRDKCFQLEYCWLGDESGEGHYTWLVNECSDIPSSQLYSPLGNNYGDNLKASGTSNGSYASWQACAANILDGGCSNICQEVYSQKLGQAYRVATGQGEEGDAIDYIESPYSKRSFRDYRDNIYSIKNSLYGTTDVDATSPVDNSLLSFMEDYGYEGTDDLSSALDEAIDALTSAMNSGIAFVDDPGNAQVQVCITAVQALDDELQEARYWIERVSVSN